MVKRPMRNSFFGLSFGNCRTAKGEWPSLEDDCPTLERAQAEVELLKTSGCAALLKGKQLFKETPLLVKTPEGAVEGRPDLVAVDGETVVLGGILTSEQIRSVFKTPFLGDLPVIGNLFRYTEESNEKVELLVFITPKIIEDGLAVR